MATHELVIGARGPWDEPPKLYLAARCTCGEWNEAWTLDELRQNLEDGETFATVCWTRVEEGVRVLHLQHLADAAQKAARAAARRPDAGFY